MYVPNVEKEQEIVSSQHTHELEHSPAPTSLAPDVANNQVQGTPAQTHDPPNH